MFGVNMTLGIAIPKTLAKGGFTRSLPTSRRKHGMLLVGADGQATRYKESNRFLLLGKCLNGFQMERGYH